MMNVPERLTSVTHPLISSIYLKKNYSGMHDSEDVLVIETNFSNSDTDEDFDSHLSELLFDLHDLQIQAEEKIGHFDRVDIRTC
jgi:hypothetical protein